MAYFIIALAAVGHAILWVAVVNRVHSVAMNRRLKDVLTGLCCLGITLIPIAFAVVARPWQASDLRQHFDEPATRLESVAWAYAICCALLCIAVIIHKLWLLAHSERRGALLANHTAVMNIRGSGSQLAAPGLPALLARLPGNEIFRPRLHEKQLAIPELPPACEGLRIAHLTDLHMSGRIGKHYFEQVVDHVNDARPDIVAITGDIIERDPCIAWIPDTFGRLQAPGGVYYVLGNHDRRVDQVRLRTALAEAGLIHLGGRVEVLRRGKDAIVLAGNELPWYGPAPVMPCIRDESTVDPLCILLAHTPDQFGWAQENGFQLMLAGHNHGGQVCVPLLGPVLVPSRHGTRYACGVFASGDTVLHVSRGTSSLSPIRYNCPPEVSILVLRQSV
jgi:uncharacterized protein